MKADTNIRLLDPNDDDDEKIMLSCEETARSRDVAKKKRMDVKFVTIVQMILCLLSRIKDD